MKQPREAELELVIEYDGLFGVSTEKSWLKKLPVGWNYWVTDSSGKIKKITRGNKYLIGESLNDVIANINRGGEYVNRKVVSVANLRKGNKDS